MKLKQNLKLLLNFLKLDLTKNLKYDRLTRLIINKVVTPESVCVDIGCHKGEIFELIIKQSPYQSHYGIEPLPHLYSYLSDKYQPKHHIFSYAMSNEVKEITFKHVKNAPEYSGILERAYHDVSKPDIEEITVSTNTLDNIIPVGKKIDLIKIDVEGAEFLVLKGAKRVLQESKPVVIFEFGLGASEFYGTKPEQLYCYLNEIGYSISSLDSWVQHKKPLILEEFCSIYHNGEEFYFVAS